MKRSTLVLLLCFAFIVWFQWELISASVISLTCYLLLTVGGLVSPAFYWQSDLFEYWLAAVVFVATAAWFALRVIRFRSRSNRAVTSSHSYKYSSVEIRGLSLMGLVAYVSLVCPFLVPVSPNFQGDLVTTRLLPPLSKGVIGISVNGYPHPDDLTDPIEYAYRKANHYILNRTISVGGGAEGPSSSVNYSVNEGNRGSSIVFLFGTDDTGRDVLSRVIYGTRVSMGIGLLAALGSILIGTCVGFTAGMSHGIVDSMLMRATDLFLAIPGLFLVIGFIAFIGQSILALVLVLSLTGWMGIARVVRGEVLTLREREFILAAKLLHVPMRRIVVRHLLPNIRPVLFTGAVLQFGNAVLAEAALGFLGLGIQPPTASWGNMMGEATGYLSTGWWVGFFPGVLLATVLVSAHYVGEGASDRRSFSLAAQES